ncbi:MAG: dephospho-CoA kinase, partial [Coriobacteriia bacterium]|nr:dephospho-CoA kinase [Coriobacteriia bacterium]
MRIFVTGGMGSGKSTLIEYLAQKGAAIIYADKVGHQNLMKPACKKALSEAFGADVIACDGEVDRAALASKAFASPEATALLDSITQPLLYEECLRQIAELEKSHDVVVLEMAILDGR